MILFSEEFLGTRSSCSCFAEAEADANGMGQDEKGMAQGLRRFGLVRAGLGMGLRGGCRGAAHMAPAALMSDGGR